MDGKIGCIGMCEPFIENKMKSIITAKPRSLDYIFNLEWFKIQLKDYLESKYSLDFIAYMTDEGIDCDRHLGIGCYDFIVCYLDDIFKNQHS